METESHRKAITEDIPFFRKIFVRYMTASVLCTLGVQLISLIASSVSGRYAGSQIFSVIALAVPALGIFTIIKATVTVGSNTECIKQQGLHDVEKLCAVYTSSLWLMLLLWFIAGVLFLCFLGPITRALCGGDGSVLPDLRLYCFISIFTLVLDMVYQLVVVNKFNLMGKPETVTGATLVRLAISLTVIVILIHLQVHWVLVVLLPNAVGFLIVLIVALCMSRREDTFIRRVGLSAGEFRECSSGIIKAGAPLGLNALYFTIETLICNALILSAFGSELFSIRGLAASYAPVLAVLLAMSSSAMPIVGVLFAEKNSGSARFVLKVGLKVIAPIVAVITILGIVFRVQLAQLMGAGSDIAMIWAPYAVACYFLSFIPCILYDVMFNLHIYNGRSKMAGVFDGVKRLVIVLPLTIIACATRSVHMMYALPFLTFAVTVVALFVVQLWYRRKNQHLSPFTLIDNEYEHVGRSVQLTTANTSEDIVHLCDEIEGFAGIVGIPRFETKILRMSYEEILQLIGAEDYENDPTMQLCVYLYVTDDEVITTVRYAGKPFDPIEYIRAHRPEQKPASGSGSDIRDLVIDTLIFKACKRKAYDTTFGINNLTLAFDREDVRAALLSSAAK